MDLQYLTDDAGNQTAVVIPIREWEDLTRQINEFKRATANSDKIKPSDFAGTMPGDIADAMHKYVREARQHWG